MARIVADRDRAVPLQQHGRRERLRRLRERRCNSSGELVAPRDPERQPWQPRQEERRLGERGRVRDFTGQRQGHCRGQMGVRDRTDIGPRGVDREVNREVGRRAVAAPRDRLTVGMIAPDDHEIVFGQLVLASSARGHEQPVGIEPDREVALARCDQTPSAEAPSRQNQSIDRVCQFHPGIVRRGDGRDGSRTIGFMPSDPAAQPLADSRPRPLAENRDFRVLLASQGVSAIGDAVSFTALPLLVLALTGSGFAMGVVGALQTLPILVLGMVAGAIADRSDQKRMMFLADLGRAGLTALIPLSAFLGGPTMVVILVVAAPMSILRSFFLAGYTAAIPALVGREQVGPANSYFEAI